MPRVEEKTEYTIGEAAEILGYSHSGLWKRIHRRECQARKVGQRLHLIPASEVRRLLAEQERKLEER
jgi:excisionase family DNA binding protein